MLPCASCSHHVAGLCGAVVIAAVNTSYLRRPLSDIISSSCCSAASTSQPQQVAHSKRAAQALMYEPGSHIVSSGALATLSGASSHYAACHR